MGVCNNSRSIINKKIINEDNPIIELNQLRQIIGSKIDVCVIKILTKTKTGTGFFCDVPEMKTKLLITNNHIIDQQYLDKENKLNYSITSITGKKIEEIPKEIDLKKDRYKLTNQEYDFTVIEILKDDNINNYLEINNVQYNEKDQIFSLQYPEGGNIKYSHGTIIKK